MMPLLRLLANETSTRAVHRFTSLHIGQHSSRNTLLGDLSRTALNALEAVCVAHARCCQFSSAFRYLKGNLEHELHGFAVAREQLLDHIRKTRTPGLRELAFSDNGGDLVMRRADHALYDTFNLYVGDVAHYRTKRLRQQRNGRPLLELIPASAYTPFADFMSMLKCAGLRVAECKMILQQLQRSRLAISNPAAYLHFHIVRRKLATPAKRVKLLADSISRLTGCALRTGNRKRVRELDRMTTLLKLWEVDFRIHLMRYSFFLAERLKRMSSQELTAWAERARDEDERKIAHNLAISEAMAADLYQGLSSAEVSARNKKRRKEPWIESYDD